MAEERSPARPDASVRKREDGPSSLARFAGSKPSTSIVHPGVGVGEVAAPPSSDGRADPRAGRGMRPARHREQGHPRARPPGSTPTENAVAALRFGNEHQRVASGQPADRAELVTADEYERRADAATRRVRRRSSAPSPTCR